MNDNWLTDGNCKECRRKKYCSKLCTKAKVRRHTLVYNEVLKTTGLGPMIDMVNKMNNGL